MTQNNNRNDFEYFTYLYFYDSFHTPLLKLFLINMDNLPSESTLRRALEILKTILLR